MIQKAGSQYGIYTLVDFHQDAWNAKVCGNGAPDWAMPATSTTFPIPLKTSSVPSDPTTGHPTRETCDAINGNQWSAYYLSYATSTAIGAVYDNEDNLRDSFVAYWSKLATKFGGSPYVLGYEVKRKGLQIFGFTTESSCSYPLHLAHISAHERTFRWEYLQGSSPSRTRCS